MQYMNALMGAHALGTTKTANSGYSTPMASVEGGGANSGGGGVNGQWINTNALFDGQLYYALLIKFIWKRQTSASGLKNSFVSDGTLVTQTLMLNTDVSILFYAGDDITITDGSNDCKPAGITNSGGDTWKTTGFCGLISATNCPVPGTCGVTGKTSAAGVAITDLSELVQAYQDSTSITSTVFEGTSSVGQDTWWPDFKAGLKQLAELGWSNLCTPGTTCDPNTLVQPSRSPVLSSAPTANPSRVPTGVPSTATPSFAPSKAPTASPTTRTPTASPTTRTPTVTPTVKPTGVPKVSACMLRLCRAAGTFFGS